MDVFYTIMEFLIPNGYLPCAALLEEYSESNITKELNTLLGRKLININFSTDYQMSKERYKKLRKRVKSIPPFVFYFNPSIELQKIYRKGILQIGFFDSNCVSVNK